MSVVVIPKSAVLSTRSCTFADHIPHAPYGHDATLALALALYSEQCVPSFEKLETDRALPYGPAYLPPISACCAGYYSFVLDGPDTSSRSRKNKIGMELLFSGAPPRVVPCRLSMLAMMGAESSRAV